MTENDPKANDPKADPKASDGKAAEPKAPAEPKRDTWKPKVGGTCTAVFMRGGPTFVERLGKIVALAKDGTATVEYQNDRGKAARLEGVEYVERGTVYSRACYTSPLD